MKRLSLQLDRVIDLGLIFVLAFTPLAFGAVEEWARSIAQFAIATIFAAWVMKLVWVPEPRGRIGRAVGASDRGKGRFGSRLRLSGIELPALTFALVIGLQLVPLPPSLLRVISPRTVEIYALSLPGYGESDHPSFSDLPRRLQEPPEPMAGEVPALPPDPEATARALPAEVFDRPHPAWRPVSLTPAHTSRALQVYLAHLAVFIVLFNWLDRRPRAMRYLYLLAGLAGVLAVLGILQDLTGTNKIYWWRSVGLGSGPFGPFVSRNNFAGWMAMVLPVCAGLAAMIWQRAYARRQSGRLEGGALGTSPAFVLVGFVTIVGFAAFLFARSRGGLLSLAAASGIYALFVLSRERLRWRTSAALVLMLVVSISMAAWIGGPEIWSRYETLGSIESEPSFRFRLATTKQTLSMATDFPWLGTGFGTFEEAFSLYTPGTSYKMLRRTHNDYAQVAAEAGLLGAIAVAWALVVLLRRGVVPGLRRGGSDFRWTIRGVAVGVLALLIHSCVDFNLQIYSNGILFVFLCAVLLRDRSGGLPESPLPG